MDFLWGGVREAVRLLLDGDAATYHATWVSLLCTFLAIVASTAMRMATPLATCRWMTDCGPSATSLAISTSRFIGPGCITIAPGRAFFMRSGVMPKAR